MSPSVRDHEEKLRVLLPKLFEEDFFKKNELCLRKILTGLSGSDRIATSYLDVFAEWLILVCDYWENSHKRPFERMSRFVLELARNLTKDERWFLVLNDANVLARLIKITHMNTLPYKLAYVKLLSSFLGHHVGLNFLVGTYYWKEVLGYCFSYPPLELLRENYSFLFNLLYKCSKFNLEFCDEVITDIMRPIVTSNTVDIKDEILKLNLTPALRLVVTILEQTLRKECITKYNCQIPHMLLKKHSFKQLVGFYMVLTRDENLMFDLLNVAWLISLTELCMNTEGYHFGKDDLRKVGADFHKLITKTVESKSVRNILKLYHLGYYYKPLIFPRLKFDRFPKIPKKQEYREGMMVLQFTPLLILPAKFTFRPVSDDDRDSFITKIFRNIHEKTLRVGYNWRDVLMAEENCYDNALKAIFYVMQSRKYYNRDGAILVFQCIVYSLKDITEAMIKDQTHVNTMVRDSNLLFALVDATATFIEDFSITWRDCVETMSVTDIVLDLLKFTCFPPKLMVQSFKLLKLSLEKYMAPNLVLLIDTGDCTLSMGPLLKGKLQDERWEIRDSAMEVVTTICRIAHSKFPPFQAIISEGKFLEFVFEMCTSDTESFVRASSIKCIKEMIQEPSFWSDSLTQQQVLEKMIQILNDETEAIVRTEATTLIQEIHTHKTFIEEMENQIYETMVCAALYDLHWEVKVRALDFWNHVINNSLQQQGMIDGSFPSVTFSKEKKIVTLTDVEIRKRLSKVLDVLSTRGCLGVLVTAMQDDCDVEVVKKAVEVTKKLVDLLNKYSLNFESYKRSTSVSSSSSGISSGSSTNLDDFLASLTNCGPSSNSSGATGSSASSLKIVTPNEFLNFVKRDLEEIVSSKTNWLNNMNSFGSLLDDMLRCYSDDVNSMDCY